MKQNFIVAIMLIMITSFGMFLLVLHGRESFGQSTVSSEANPTYNTKNDTRENPSSNVSSSHGIQQESSIIPRSSVPNSLLLYKRGLRRQRSSGGSVRKRRKRQSPKSKYFSETTPFYSRNLKKAMALDKIDSDDSEYVGGSMEFENEDGSRKAMRHAKRRTKRSAREMNPREVPTTRRGKNTEIDVIAKLPVETSGSSRNEKLENKLTGLLKHIMETMKEEYTDEVEGHEEGEVEGNSENEEDSLNELTEHHEHTSINHIPKPLVKPSLECDEWVEERSLCYYDRNIGDTITFQLQYENLHLAHVARVQWKQEYHVRYSNHTKTVNISPDDTVWNVVVGSNGKEFRISPITETDFHFNKFSAVVAFIHPQVGSHSHVVRKVSFAIRPVPIDMGFVYPGEQLNLNVESFGSLPLESLGFHWYIEGDSEMRSLPSNMKVSLTGSSVAISELRKEQEGIISCAVYKSKNDVFLTKKRFLIKEINRDILVHGLGTENSGKGAAHHEEGNHVLRRIARQVINIPQPEKLDAGKESDKSQMEARNSSQSTELPDNETYKKQTLSASNENAVNPSYNIANNNGNPSGVQNNDLYNSMSQMKHSDSSWFSNGASQNGQLRNGFYQAPSGNNNLLPLLQTSPQFQSNDNRLQQQLQVGKADEQKFFQHEKTQDVNEFPVGSNFANLRNIPGDSGHTEEVVFQVGGHDVAKLTAEDQINKLIAECINDKECSGHATCYQTKDSNQGICKCLPKYRGNGIFCWEMIIPGHPVVFSSV